jgi:class 3 adenylate cyclase/predicted ATPase
MICDLVGSTALSARLDPEDMREIIAIYHRCCAEQITKAGGFVAKYMGDGVLAYFGYPQAHENDAERAINAGLGVLKAVQSLTAGKGASLAVRIGIATGRVVVGDIIGEGASQEAAIVGEAPNLAARLQAIAQPNSIVVAETTHALAGGLFECTSLGAQVLKGFDTPVNAWSVSALRAIESRFEATRMRAPMPFVGREEELDILERRWRRACAGEGQVILLSGEPGIGKSRIVVALQERLGAQSHTWLRYQCSTYHTNSALYPVIDQLERAACIGRNDSPDDKLDKLEALLALSRCPGIAAIPLIAPLLSIPLLDRYPPLNVSPQRQKQATLAVLVDQLTGVASQRPVLFHFEDAHWIDPTSRELLDMIAARVPTVPILVVISFRSEFSPAWTGERYVTLLGLKRLEPRTCADLAAQIGGAGVLPTEIVDEIVVRADGVPLFIEEITKSVLEASITSTVSANTQARVAIPASIEDSLMARLDRLGPVKEVAQIAAVVGRTFSHDVLSAVVTLEGAALEAALDRLLAAGLVHRRAVAGDVAYEFKHALVRDAAYRSLLKSSRQRHHARIANVLEAQFSSSVEPEVLAYHYTEAGRIEQAIDYWLNAGQRAVQRSAHIEAERHLRKGLELLAGLSDTVTRDRLEIALQNALGVCLMPTRGFGNPDVAAAFTRATEICERVADARGLFVSLRGKGQYHMVSGEVRTACEDTRRILMLAERMGEHDFLIEAHHLGWSAFCFAGEFRAAQRHAEEGIARYERGRDHHLTYTYSGHDPGMCCRAFGSLSLAQLGYAERALALCRDGLALAEALAHPFTVAIALWAIGILHQLRREPHATREAGERMIRHCSDKGLRPMVAFGKIFRGDALARQGEFVEGLAQMRQGIDESRSTGNVFTLPSFFPALASAYARSGDVSLGLAALEEGLAMTRRGGDRFSLPEIHHMKAKLLLARSASDTDAADAAYREAIEVARNQHARLLQLRASTSLARLWRDQGKRGEAFELLAPIYGWFTEGFDTPDLKEAKALLEELG